MNMYTYIDILAQKSILTLYGKYFDLIWPLVGFLSDLQHRD